MAWHLYGALNAAKWDKQYTERQIIRRVLPYLRNHRKYLIPVIVFSLLSTLRTSSWPRSTFQGT